MVIELSGEWVAVWVRSQTSIIKSEIEHNPYSAVLANWLNFVLQVSITWGKGNIPLSNKTKWTYCSFRWLISFCFFFLYTWKGKFLTEEKTDFIPYNKYNTATSSATGNSRTISHMLNKQINIWSNRLNNQCPKSQL